MRVQFIKQDQGLWGGLEGKASAALLGNRFDGLSLIPWTHMVEVVFCEAHVYYNMKPIHTEV